jgi:hypothetical protein
MPSSKPVSVEVPLDSWESAVKVIYQFMKMADHLIEDQATIGGGYVAVGTVVEAKDAKRAAETFLARI